MTQPIVTDPFAHSPRLTGGAAPPSEDGTLEARTVAIGKDLFARVRHASRRTAAAWLDDQMMGLTMRDEHVKAQLFRFVDVLPVLKRPEQITRHLREYLLESAHRLPAPLRRAVHRIPDQGFLARRLANAAETNARRMARRFIAATELDEAAEAVIRMRRQGLAFTIDVLGEAVVSTSEADAHQQLYLKLVEGLADRLQHQPEHPLLDRDHAGPIPRVNVSVKLSSLYSQFDAIDPAGTSRAVRDRLRPILHAARRSGVFVNLDMEQFSYKDVSLRIFQEVLSEPELRDWPDVGIAIQAYLKRCLDDLENLRDWACSRGTPVWVRLVKGAYWDYETVIAAQNGWPAPVFTEKPATDANYEACTTFLMQNWQTLRPAIASHNIRSIAHTLALAERLDLPKRGYEFQMLYGMADPIKAALTGLGHRVRIYTPFGQLLPGMAYLVRRLLENTSNESFLRAGFLEHAPEEQLLMNPLTKLRSMTAKTARGAAQGTNGATGASGANGNGYAKKVFRNEPVSDFSQQPARDAMARALEQVKPALGRTWPLVINGQRVRTEQTLESLNPSHRSQVVGRTARPTTEHARHAVEAAKAAFPAWRDTPPQQRANLLFRVADVLRRRRFELAAVEVYECAKPWREADADLAEAIDFCDYYATESLKLMAGQHRDVPGETNRMFYEPRGVAVVIAPWNFPLAILCGMTAAAVVTGNAVVMKPAEQSPVIAAYLQEAFEEAGCPPGVVNYLPGIGEEIGPALVQHPDVATIAFTGSRAVGLMLNEQAARTPPGQEHVKRVIDEMGGKNAVIVDDDADLDEAIHGVVASAFGYAGQKCSACSRVIVLEGIYDAFIRRLVEATRSLQIGPAEDPGTGVPPVIDAEAQANILKAIDRGKAECRVAYAGDAGALAEEGLYVAPHVFADVSPSAWIAQHEIFGPVLAAMKARDLTEALAIANGTPYALTGGLYSRSPANIERVRREFRVGNLYINRKITGALVDRQPFGGFKLSGIGSKAGGPDYLLQFLLPRVVTENTLRRGFAPEAETQASEGGI